MEFLKTPNTKNTIATWLIVTKEKSKLTFLLILYFHVPKTSAYIKSYNDETKWMHFFDWRWWAIKKYNIFGKTSAIVLTKNLIANPKILLKTKIKWWGYRF